jgi:hypothetical protein
MGKKGQARGSLNLPAGTSSLREPHVFVDEVWMFSVDLSCSPLFFFLFCVLGHVLSASGARVYLLLARE